MPRLRRSLALLCALVPAVAAVHAEDKRPFSVEDLVRLKRVSEPALSPDGATVAFSVRETDMDANRGRQDLWSLDLTTKGAQPRRLTTHPRERQRARSGRRMAVISTFCPRAAVRRRSGDSPPQAAKPNR